MRRILGIDPGSRITGFGIIELHGKNKPICIAHGCVRLEEKSMPHRLGKLFIELQQIINNFQPTELAIEQVFVHKNPNSALKLGQARGVCIAAVMTLHIPVFEYAPREIKKAIVGIGSADKTQVQKMVQILLGLNQKPQVDASDALAIAMCHLHNSADNLLKTKTALPSKRTGKRFSEWKTYDRTNTRKVN